MSGSSFSDVLVDELTAVFEPLYQATTDEDSFREFLTALEYAPDDDQFDSLFTALDAVGDAYEYLDGDTDDADFAQKLAMADEVVQSVVSLTEAIDDDELDDLPTRLVEYLVLTYFQRERPLIIRVGLIVGLFTIPSLSDLPPEESDGIPYYAGHYASLNTSQIAALADDPVAALSDQYLPSSIDSSTDADEALWPLFARLSLLFNSFGFRVRHALQPQDGEDLAGVTDLSAVARRLLVRRELGEDTEVGALLSPAMDDDGELYLLAAPYGSTGVDYDTDRWAFSLSITGETDAFIIGSDGMVDAPDLDTPDDVTITVDASLDRLPDPDDESDAALTVGNADGTHISFGTLGLASSNSIGLDNQEYGVMAKATDSSLTVAADDGYGFIQHVLPEDGIGVDFDAGLGWSIARGMYFEGGSGGLDADLPLHFSIGDVLTVETLHLAAKPDSSGDTVTVPVQVAASPQVSLGPVDAVVEEIGLEAEIAFPENNDGNLGPLDVTLGFKPPSGAGLSVDAGPVVGGGYLTFEPEQSRYAGVLQLGIGDLTLEAIGLLTTELPDGRDGFSLLVIITGEFPPVQLGFGFTLNAVGGLLGINRTMEVNVLRDGLRDGTTKSVLFPEDPIRNAPTIISDLRNVFPPASGRHVFGPMAKLGWGTPTIMTAEIGVLMELPEPVQLVILGRLHAALPDENAALIVFNMDAIGVVDFGEKEASIDATLFDSRVLAYTLSGDMAMRTNWGDDPEFTLAVGGFNPRYDAPDDFPELDRVALSLGDGNPELRCAGYFALTSNSAQFGAGVEMYAEAGKFSVDGHMGFDALFYFDPFEFIIDFEAGFAVKRGSRSLLTVDLAGTLSGPAPWHVHGEASFKIGFISASVSIDKSFGSDDQPGSLPPADVFGKLVDALEDERNWAAQRPEGGESIVTLREIDAADGTILAHPLGKLEVRQTVVPLGYTVDTVGNATPDTYDNFAITDVSFDGTGDGLDTEALHELFAPAEYFDVSEEDKLDGPSFERYEAGRRVVKEAVGFGGADDDQRDRSEMLRSTADLLYETDIIDSQAHLPLVEWTEIAMTESTAEARAACSAVAKSPLRTTGNAKFEGTDDASGPTGVEGRVTVDDGAYTVVRATDLRPVSYDGEVLAGLTKYKAKQRLESMTADEEIDDTAYRVVCAHESQGAEVTV